MEKQFYLYKIVRTFPNQPKDEYFLLKETYLTLGKTLLTEQNPKGSITYKNDLIEFKELVAKVSIELNCLEKELVNLATQLKFKVRFNNKDYKPKDYQSKLGLEVSSHNLDINSCRISSRRKGENLVEIKEDQRDNLQAKVYHKFKVFLSYSKNEEEVSQEEFKSLIISQLQDNNFIRDFYLSKVLELTKKNSSQDYDTYNNYKAFIITLNYLNWYNRVNLKRIEKINLNCLQKDNTKCNNIRLSKFELNQNLTNEVVLKSLSGEETFLNLFTNTYYSLWSPKEIEEIWIEVRDFIQ